MIELYHPVSGEHLTCFTDEEAEIIKLALNELNARTSSHVPIVGGVDCEV